ncbi:MAG TPA: heme ABC transporter ATP-binding protein, partial [Myxococcales bacterium]|nr:heme ABC transporter ATP-binding protein [Myxococcales bacterium]
MSASLLRMQGITCRFPGDVYANREIDFEVQKGEVHALLGENGAGKSTLMKIAFGMLPPTEGQIFWEETPVSFRSASDAMAHGIGMVHQHFMLIPSFTVWENIVLGHEPTHGPHIDKERAREQVKKLSDDYGLHIDPDALVEHLSVGERQRVEILKALYRQIKLLILDEPTAVLTPQEADALFLTLRQLVDEGLTIIFISHKLAEVL